jgi:PIN domain nuclease of toxin-antitoxin system
VIVLDTHALIWWQSEPKRLGKKAARALKGAKRVGVPAICLWEFAMLEAKGRIRLDRTALAWLNEVLELPQVELLPLTPSVAVQSTRLPSAFHGDPADRLIVATALVEAAPLLSTDRRLDDVPGLQLVWD